MNLQKYAMVMPFAGLACWLLATSALAAIDVSCVDCADRDDDRTVNLLVLDQSTEKITIEWVADNNPASENASVKLYAGNPTFTDVIPDLGEIEFQSVDNVWVFSRTFDVDTLGRGTFLTVLVRESRNNREILDWRAHRTATVEDLERQRNIQTSGGNWSVDITPALLQVSSGHGDLPRSTGGDERVWWSLWATEGNVSDADLDGEDTGVAGIGVQVSTPWHARENWRDSIQEKLTGIEGHTTKFGDLRWVELPDRQIELGPDRQPIDIRHYYTIVTLHTNAGVRAFSAREVGRSGRKRYFSHETSANLKPPPDARFWASYSRRDHSADSDLLGLLQEQISNGSVPGLTDVQTVDGDGGSTLYRVGLVASARPWLLSAMDDDGSFVAGFVGVDVVAARAGLGSVRIGEGTDGALICSVLRCDSDDKSLDLNDPPKGYGVAQPVASLDTLSGKLPMSNGKPALAQRDIERLGEANAVPLPNLPSQTRFSVGANLRAGALIRKKGLFGGRVDNVVPVDAYAQFVIKMTLAMVPNAEIVDNKEMVAPKPEELDVLTVTPPRPGPFAWLSDFLNFSSLGKFIVMGGIAVLLLIFVPGLRRLLSAVLDLFASAIRRFADALKPKPG